MEYKPTPLNQHGVHCYNPIDLQSVGEELGLSQAVVIPAHLATVVTSGQCGFHEDGSLEKDPEKQILLAFENAEKTLRAAGVVDGWKAVYQMTTYCPSFDDVWLASMLKAKDRYLGTNRPAWTGVQVSKLYDNAVVEMTLYAVIPKSQQD